MEAVESRQKIIETAGAMIADLGYEAVSIREIAAEVHVDVDEIRRLFGSKSGLYDEILKTVASSPRLQAIASGDPDEGDPVENLRTVAHAVASQCGMANGDGWRFRLIANELLRSKSRSQMVVGYWMPGYRYVARQISRIRGRSDPKRDTLLACGFFCLLDNMASFRDLVQGVLGTSDDPRQYLNWGAEEVVRLFLNGLN
ncbi:MAG: TetR/AcrR family transcriptional regulator [Fimbriimonadaceae bacterium]